MIISSSRPLCAIAHKGRDDADGSQPRRGLVQRDQLFDDLPSFLAIYYDGMSVLLTENDFYALAWAYLNKAHEQLPESITSRLPDSFNDFREQGMGWAHSHAGDLRLVGTTAARVFAHILIGLVLGAIVAISHVSGARR